MGKGFGLEQEEICEQKVFVGGQNKLFAKCRFNE